MLLASPSLRAEPASLAGCYELLPPVHRDARGLFVKTFHEEVYAAAHLATRFVEEYTVPSWEEHLRQHHGRLTGADVEIEREVDALSDPPPQTRHLFPA